MFRVYVLNCALLEIREPITCKQTKTETVTSKPLFTGVNPLIFLNPAWGKIENWINAVSKMPINSSEIEMFSSINFHNLNMTQHRFPQRYSDPKLLKSCLIHIHRPIHYWNASFLCLAYLSRLMYWLLWGFQHHCHHQRCLSQHVFQCISDKSFVITGVLFLSEIRAPILLIVSWFENYLSFSITVFSTVG